MDCPNLAKTPSARDPPLLLALRRALGVAPDESFEQRLAKVVESLCVSTLEEEEEDAGDDCARGAAWLDGRGG